MAWMRGGVHARAAGGQNRTKTRSLHLVEGGGGALITYLQYESKLRLQI